MYKFKGFDSTQCGDDISALESMINTWMESEHPRIRHVCQSMRGEHILLSFVYEVTRELDQRATTVAQTGCVILLAAHLHNHLQSILISA